MHRNQKLANLKQVLQKRLTQGIIKSTIEITTMCKYTKKAMITASQPKMTRAELFEKEKRNGLPESYLKNIATHNKNNRDFFKRLREKSN